MTDISRVAVAEKMSNLRFKNFQIGHTSDSYSTFIAKNWSPSGETLAMAENDPVLRFLDSPK